MTLALYPQLNSSTPIAAHKTLQAALALGDLLDLYRPNLERRFLLDLLSHCSVTDEDVLELGMSLLKDAQGLPQVAPVAHTLRQAISQLSLVPVQPLAA